MTAEEISLPMWIFEGVTFVWWFMGEWESSLVKCNSRFRGSWRVGVPE